MPLDLKIDKVDKRILRDLVKDARKPYTEIAKELAVSPGTIHVRVKKLELLGIIKGTSLQIDYTKLGYGFISYIGLYLNRSSRAMDVIISLKEIPEITVAHLSHWKIWYFLQDAL